METRLAKLRKVTFGPGGYQNADIGVTLDIGGNGWGVGDFIPVGDPRLKELFESTKKTSVAALEGTPVEVTFDGMMMKSWRVLTEVL